MAEIPDRMAFEARFARELSRLTSKQRHEFRDKIGTPPDYSRITPEDWQRWERERRNRLLLFLLLAGLDSAETHAEEVEAAHPEAGDLKTAARQHARDWALKRSEILASEQVRNARERLDELANQWRQMREVPPELVDSDLVDTFAPRFDAATAATETTAGNSAGANGALNAARAAGVPMVLRWFTRADDRVCPICGPLHRKSIDLWELVVSNTQSSGRASALASIRENNGPPAHPNCRCYAELVPLREPIGALTP